MRDILPKIFALIWLLNQAHVFASSPIKGSENNLLQIADHIIQFNGSYRYYIDQSGSMDVNQFLDLTDGQVDRLDNGNVSHFQGRAWLSYKMQNPDQRARDVKIVFTFTASNKVKLYTVTNGTPEKQEIALSEDTRHEFRTPTFNISFEAGETKTLVFSFGSSNYATRADHYVMPPRDWPDFYFFDTLFYGLFMGAFVAIYFYNLFLYFSSKHRPYLFYLTFCSFIGILTAIDVGYLEKFVPFFDSHDPLRIQLYLRPFASISAMAFGRSFLNTDKYNPKFVPFYNLISIMILINLGLELLGINTRYNQIFSDLASVTLGFLVLVDAVICHRRGSEGSLTFLIAWIGMLIPVIIWYLSQHSVIPVTHIGNKLPHFGLIFQMVYMSFNIGRLFFKYEKSLEKAKEKHREAETMSRLLSVLSHDINTPLGVIKGSAEIITLRNSMEVTNKFVPKISRAANKLEEITENVRKFIAVKSSKMEVKLEPVSFKKIIEDTKFLFSDKLEAKNLSLDVQCDEKDLQNIVVLAEESSLGNDVINNLVSNAIKFSERGSAIVLGIKKKNQKVMITVKDHGVGIPDEMIPHLFSNYIPTHRDGTEDEGGTGFGMPIVKTYVEAYGGEIAVDSIDDLADENHGTTFTITLNAAA